MRRDRLKNLDDRDLRETITAQLLEIGFDNFPRAARARLATYRTIRDAGVLPPDAGFFLVVLMLERITVKRIESEQATTFKEINDRVKGIRERHGLSDDESWPKGEGPWEFHALEADWERIADRIFVDVCWEHGEQDMADLYLGDRVGYEGRYEAGRQFFFDRKPASGPDLGPDVGGHDGLEPTSGP